VCAPRNTFSLPPCGFFKNNMLNRGQIRNSLLVVQINTHSDFLLLS
jgi:hypothetical protein